MKFAFVYFCLSILLFFAINFIGKNSRGIGYIQLSVFPQRDEAPAFNFVFRIITPTIFIIIASLIFYHVKLDKFILHIWVVVPMQFLVRFSYNIICGRLRLINWPFQIFIGLVASTISYIVYIIFLSDKLFFLPPKEDMVSSFWLIVVLFVYNLFNRVKLPSMNTKKRKMLYINNRLKKFRKKYATTIDKRISDTCLSRLVYAIMIVEDFNRPYFARLLERLLHPAISKTTGIMQVNSLLALSDIQSINMAIDKVASSYERYYSELHNECVYFDDKETDSVIECRRRSAIGKTIYDYNKSGEYVRDVQKVFSMIEDIDAI